MSQTTTKLPPYVSVGGVPLFIKETDVELNAANLLSRSDIDTQSINILTTIPVERQHRLLCGELASQLLYAAGLDMAECDRIYIYVGNTLHNMLKDNNFTWVTDLKTEIPTAVKINGITYAIKSDDQSNDYLDHKRLAGECAYDILEIKLDSRLAPTAKRVILCHEIVHGLLHESGYGDKNNEALVRPLGFFLYLFLRDNDFNFLRGC